MYKQRKLFDSFNYAIEGVMYVLKTQKNMRLHFLCGLFVLLLGIYFNLSKVELILLLLTICFVFITEMLNTSIELVIDLITNEFHPLARIIKDISAGAVLVASVNAVLVGYLLLLTVLHGKNFYSNIEYIKQRPLHIVFISLFVVVAGVMFSKASSGRGKPLRGGMPSGHSAISFSIWMVTFFLSKNILIVTLVFLLAVFIAQSRLKLGYHSRKEVIAGALLGIRLTSFVFYFFKF